MTMLTLQPIAEAMEAAVTPPTGARSYLYLRPVWGHPIKLNVLQEQKTKAKQTKDNCICVHFLKQNQKWKIQRHSHVLLCLPDEFVYSFQIEVN